MTKAKTKPATKQIDLSVKPVAKKNQSFVTRGMMFNKA